MQRLNIYVYHSVFGYISKLQMETATLLRAQEYFCGDDVEKSYLQHEDGGIASE
jgi:hypothetical protein